MTSHRRSTCVAALLCLAFTLGAGPPANADVDGPVTVKLGGVADVVQAGAGGRLLVFHLKDDAERLTVVDTLAGRVLGHVAAPGAVRFSADRDKLVVVLNDQHIVQRWDLATLRKEQSVLLGDDRPVGRVSLGCDGNGPLAMWFAGGTPFGDDPANGVQFWDVATLRKLDVHGDVDHPTGDGPVIWPSADGHTFCLWGWTSGPYDLLHLGDVTPTSLTCRLTHTADGEDYNRAWAMPTADGTQLVKHGAVVYDATTATPIAAPPGPLSGATLLPTVDPRYLIALRRIDARDHPSNALSVVAACDRRVIYTVDDVEPVTGGQIDTDIGRLGVDPRVYYLPADKRVVLIPDGDDHVVVHPFDLPAALRQTGASYLFVTSKPPVTATAGTAFSYQIETLSSSTPLTYHLDQGPTGMAVSAGGLVTWSARAAPDDPAGERVPVVVTVSDGTEQQATHGFAVRVVRRSPGPAQPPPTVVDAAPAAPPISNDPEVASVAQKLARRVESHLQDETLDEIDDRAHVRVTVVRADRVSEPTDAVLTAHLILLVRKTVASRPGVDGTKTDSNLTVQLRHAPGQAWMCLSADMVMTSVDAGHGPDTSAGRHRVRTMMPTVRAALAEAQANDAPSPTTRPALVRGPKDPALSVIGGRLAAYLKADLTDAAKDDPDYISVVTVGVVQATATPAVDGLPAGRPADAGRERGRVAPAQR